MPLVLGGVALPPQTHRSLRYEARAAPSWMAIVTEAVVHKELSCDLCDTTTPSVDLFGFHQDLRTLPRIFEGLVFGAREVVLTALRQPY